LEGNLAETKTDINVRVAQYVKLRDFIKEKDDIHKKEIARYKETLDKLNAVLLDHLNVIGANSVATDGGTVYRTERKSASLADPKAFMDFVIANNAYDLLDRKANSVAVEAFIKENDAPPPGCNFNSTFVVGVRRA
jgi:CRISPR/Cas system-associated protein Cas7 (RAMP superfamily)